MPPPKKAPKKAAKKAARNHPDHHQASDLRRAYEHMSRVEILLKSLSPSNAKAVTALAVLARQQLESGSNQEAADLLRGLEHLSFAALADEDSKKVLLSDELVQSITEHFYELIGRADEHWEDHEEAPGTLTAIYMSSRKSATRSFMHGAYHKALEFARAAEALALVKKHGPRKLEHGKKALQHTVL